jgi:hypothetical protein
VKGGRRIFRPNGHGFLINARAAMLQKPVISVLDCAIEAMMDI